jgi:acetyltransferase-like isoleucine patch superfamily enzyme
MNGSLRLPVSPNEYPATPSAGGRRGTAILDTPWKAVIELRRICAYPRTRLIFLISGVAWGKEWRLFGTPIIQKHRCSRIQIGDRLGLRSFVSSNPLGPTHPVILCTWQAGAVLKIGDDFGMTGGSICAAERIAIGDRVIVGANTTIVDTDFHSLDPTKRRLMPAEAKTTPIVIEDDVFIGMNCLILKGVTLGRKSVVGAGSVVTRDVPPGGIAAGNPARLIRYL